MIYRNVCARTSLLESPAVFCCFDRIGTIVKANINELIDKFEDPEKLIDQTIIDAVQEYGNMKEASLDVLANETLTKK